MNGQAPEALKGALPMAKEVRAVAAVVERLQRPSLLRRPWGLGHFDLLGES